MKKISEEFEELNPLNRKKFKDRLIWMENRLLMYEDLFFRVQKESKEMIELIDILTLKKNDKRKKKGQLLRSEDHERIEDNVSGGDYFTEWIKDD